MEKTKVYDLIEQNRDLFLPNNKYSDIQIEEALINAPEGIERSLANAKFRSPAITDFLAKLTIGGDRLYLGDYKKALLKIITVGGLGIWYIKDQKSAKSRCRARNCELLLNMIQ